MHSPFVRCLLFSAVLAGTASGQHDRRDRREPALVLNTGGRTGYCDALKFSPDGQFLLAAGDDKVVSIWRHSDHGLDPASLQTLRWPIWREQRGSIYAMDISPDGKRVAIGGLGLRNTTVMILDRDSGKVLATTWPDMGQRNFFHVSAVAFSPNGNELTFGSGDGSVWRWDFKEKPRLLGTHAAVNGRNSGINWVRLVRFTGDDLISIAEDGELLRWTAGRSNSILRVDGNATVRSAAIDPGGVWLACALTTNRIAVRHLADGSKRDIPLPPRYFPRCLAFDADGKRLAVGIGSAVSDSSFFIEADEPVHVFNLAGMPPKAEVVLPHAGRAEAIAWRGRDRLAIAGGDNHEVTLFDLGNPKSPLSAIRGAGTGLWGVGLSANGRYLAFHDKHNPESTNPNERGAGDWRVFDLKQKKFEAQLPEGVKIVQPIRRSANWAVEPDDKNSYVWYAVDPDGRRHVLPLDRDRDGMPRCFTFLDKNVDSPTLAVGHYWGVSIFSLAPQGVRRTRLLTGHQGEVTAVAPSADGTLLLSASSDQTISVFSLKPWPSSTPLGAAIGEDLKVSSVDIGSPVWEAGLLAGDEIALVGITENNKPKIVYKWPAALTYKVGERAVPMDAGAVGDAAAATALLANPEPGKEIFLVWKRAGQTDCLAQPTTVRNRPLWRFFPTRDNEWVLWMWQNGYYDTSTHGDFHIAWHVNDPNMDREPRLIPVERMRAQFQREEVIDELLNTGSLSAALKVAQGVNPLPLNFEKLEPAGVKLAVSNNVAAGDITATLTAAPRTDNPDLQPRRVEFWINDFRWKFWDKTAPQFEQKLVVTPDLLRSGPNKLLLQVFNRLGGRSDAGAIVTKPGQVPERRLFGLPVGINDYSESFKTPDGKRDFGNLASAVNDAQRQSALWKLQEGKLYNKAEIIQKLDKNARRADLVAVLDQIARDAQPDDQFLMLLAGHGDFLVNARGSNRSTFVFCGPDYDRAKFEERGLDSETLCEKLAAIRCRKVVFLDACHAGDVVYDRNLIRELTPGGQGPIIMAACGRSEYSYEDPARGDGVFSLAVMQTLGDGFAAADTDQNGSLDARELFDAVRKRVPDLLEGCKKPRHAQNPLCFPQMPEKYPIFQK